MSLALHPTLDSSADAIGVQLASLRSLGTRLEEFFTARLAALEELRLELHAQAEILAEERTRGEQTEQALDQARLDLDDERATRSRVEAERDEAIRSFDELESALDAMEEGRIADRNRLNALQESLEAALAERDSARANLESLLRENSEAGGGLDPQPEGRRCSSGAGATESARIAELEAERLELERQMESILESAAELAASRARESEQLRAEQAAWREEIESLRRALAHVAPDMRRAVRSPREDRVASQARFDVENHESGSFYQDAGQDAEHGERGHVPSALNRSAGRGAPSGRAAVRRPTANQDPVLQAVAAEFSKLRGEMM